MPAVGKVLLKLINPILIAVLCKYMKFGTNIEERNSTILKLFVKLYNFCKKEKKTT